MRDDERLLGEFPIKSRESRIFGITGQRPSEQMIRRLAGSCRSSPIFAGDFAIAEMNVCNHCSLNWLKNLAESQQKFLKISDGSSEILTHGFGKNMHIVSDKSEEISGENMVAWMAIIPENCCC